MMDVAYTVLENRDLSFSLPQNIVNITDKKRSNLFTWRGQFSPQLIEEIIKTYAKEDDVLFDPFLGSGTLLLEAAIFGLNAMGTELNPAAYGLALIYKLSTIEYIEREIAIDEIDRFLIDFFPNKEIHNSIPKKEISTLKDNLVRFYQTTQGETEKIIVNNLIIGLDFEQTKIEVKKLDDAWSKLKEKIRNLPKTNSKLDVYLGDARETQIKNGAIDFVITSPPYINVFNYHQNYRKSVEAMGFDVLNVAKSEIGSNRKFRGNRFLTVIQYCLDIYQVFTELKRICKSNAKIIFIVGRESSVRKTSFSNAKLLTEIAVLAGFELQGEQPRSFKNKFGQVIFEEILRFSLADIQSEYSISKAREVGVKYLQTALITAPNESLEDLRNAIAKAQEIKPSIIYK